MGKEELIVRLIEIANNLKSEGKELDKEIETLTAALEAIKGINNLEKEIIHFIKKAMELERLLIEASAFCPVLHRNEIDRVIRGECNERA